MTSQTPSQLSPDDVRRAPSYPRMLTAARVYVAAMAGFMVTAGIVAAVGVQTWTYVLIAAIVLTWIAAAVLARGAFQALEAELGANPRSAAVIATRRDLVVSRRAGG